MKRFPNRSIATVVSDSTTFVEGERGKHFDGLRVVERRGTGVRRGCIHGLTIGNQTPFNAPSPMQRVGARSLFTRLYVQIPSILGEIEAYAHVHTCLVTVCACRFTHADGKSSVEGSVVRENFRREDKIAF